MQILESIVFILNILLLKSNLVDRIRIAKGLIIVVLLIYSRIVWTESRINFLIILLFFLIFGSPSLLFFLILRILNLKENVRLKTFVSYIWIWLDAWSFFLRFLHKWPFGAFLSPAYFKSMRKFSRRLLSL